MTLKVITEKTFDSVIENILMNDPEIDQIAFFVIDPSYASKLTALFDALAQNTKIGALYLNDSKIGDAEAIALAAALRQNNTIIKLELTGNKIGDTGAIALAEVLAKRTTKITELNLINNPIGNAGYVKLNETLGQNVKMSAVAASSSKRGLGEAAKLSQPKKHQRIKETKQTAVIVAPPASGSQEVENNSEEGQLNDSSNLFLAASDPVFDKTASSNNGKKESILKYVWALSHLPQTEEKVKNFILTDFIPWLKKTSDTTINLLYISNIFLKPLLNIFAKAGVKSDQLTSLFGCFQAKKQLQELINPNPDNEAAFVIKTCIEEKILSPYVARIYHQKGLPDKKDLKMLIELHRINKDLLQYFTTMRKKLGMPSKEDFRTLIKLCGGSINEDNKITLHKNGVALFICITWMQRHEEGKVNSSKGKGMVSADTLQKLIATEGGFIENGAIKFPRFTIQILREVFNLDIKTVSILNDIFNHQQTNSSSSSIATSSANLSGPTSVADVSGSSGIIPPTEISVRTSQEFDNVIRSVSDHDSQMKVITFYIPNHLYTLNTTDQFEKLFSALANNKTVIKLNLENSKITDKEVTLLAEALQQNTTLEELNLSFNHITDEGATALAEALAKNNTITTLYLSDNQIGAAGATALAEALQQNTTLKNFCLSGNKRSPELLASVEEYLERNNAAGEQVTYGNFPGLTPDAMQRGTVVTTATSSKEIGKGNTTKRTALNEGLPAPYSKRHRAESGNESDDDIQSISGDKSGNGKNETTPQPTSHAPDPATTAVSHELLADHRPKRSRAESGNESDDDIQSISGNKSGRW